MIKVEFKTDLNNTKIINIYALLKQWAISPEKKQVIEALENNFINASEIIKSIEEPNVKRFAEFLYFYNYHDVKVSDKAIKELEQELNNLIK